MYSVRLGVDNGNNWNFERPVAAGTERALKF